MPLTNRDLSNERVSPTIFDIRNDCTKSQWKIGDKDLVGDSLDMIVLRYETGIGSIPPIKTFDQLAKEFKRNQKPLPSPDDTETIQNFLVDRQQVWCYIWFLPVFVPGSKLAELAEKNSVPKDCVWGTFIKSRSLDGSKTTGFWKHVDQVAGMKKDLIDVISCPRFDVTHQMSGTGQDCFGLKWSSREPSESEQGVIENAKLWINDLVEDGRADKVLHLPDIAKEQFRVIEDDAVRGYTLPEIVGMKQMILMEALGQTRFGTEIDIYSLGSSSPALLKSAVDVSDKKLETSDSDIPVQTVDAQVLEPVAAGSSGNSRRKVAGA